VTCSDIVDIDGTIHVGAVAPYAISVDVTTDDAAFDLSTATAGRLEVTHANGMRSSWAAALEASPPNLAVTATQLRLTRTLQAGDVPDPGVLSIVPVVTMPGGEAYFETLHVEVEQP